MSRLLLRVRLLCSACIALPLLLFGMTQSLPLAALALVSLTITLSMAFLSFVRPFDCLIESARRFVSGRVDLPEAVEVPLRHTCAPLADMLALFRDALHSQCRTFWAERLEKEALLTSIEEGVVVIDAKGSITQMNEVAKRVLGEDGGLERLTPHVDEALESGEVWSDTCSLGEGAYRVTITPRAHQGGAIVTLLDASRAGRFEQMGRDLIANASHELRTPITVIKGFAETLRDMPEISDAMLEEITTTIVSNCTRMERLVEALMTLAQLDGVTTPAYEEVDLFFIADRVKKNLLAQYPSARLDIISTTSEGRVSCDGPLIELALMKLLENGVQYSKGEPTLELRIDSSHEALVLTVADTGIGIPKEELSAIFDRFYTVDKAHSHEQSGFGLGLAIVQRIAALHDATLDVESNERGTAISLTLPLQRTAAPA